VFDATLFIASTILAWVLVLGMRRWAQRVRLVDTPNPRSMHRHATPSGGGAAIVVVCLAGIAIAVAFGLRPAWWVLGGYFVGALLIVGVSFVDDVRELPIRLRLAVHFLGAAAMVGGLAIGSDSLTRSPAGAAWLLLAAALFWTAGLTNAYNFMDGIDGLAATQGLVAGLGWTLLASFSQQPWLALLALLVAAGCTGFLIHNWPPASIFMGDVGSAFLGFTFAFMSLAALPRTPQLALMGALLVWPFIFDTFLAVLRRLLQGENIFVAHRSHLYQRLVLAGWRQDAVTFLYGLVALAILALDAIWLIVQSRPIGYLAVTLSLLLPLGIWALVLRAERKLNRPAIPAH
jgi:UDP-N-acetylmuramyl pentapeptide phosphotransferase/UDP-N-acetylglucosamine-1-phosphate transferase